MVFDKETYANIYSRTMYYKKMTILVLIIPIFIIPSIIQLITKIVILITMTIRYNNNNLMPTDYQKLIDIILGILLLFRTTKK